jgi:hypothetical protein
MTQGPRTLCLAAAWLALAVAPRAALAVPIVYASAADDGTNSGVAAIAPDSVPATLNLYLDPDELAYEYVVGFETSAGLSLYSFTADDSSAVVSFDVSAGTLAVTASLGGGSSDPVRIGTLVVIGSAAGGELRLADLANASTPFLTNASFGLTPIPVPQTVAVVRDAAAPIPEPDARWLFFAGVLVVALALRRVEPQRG